MHVKFVIIKFLLRFALTISIETFLDKLPKPNGNEIVYLYSESPLTWTGMWIPNLAISCWQRAVVRALMDRAENVCSDPVIFAKEMEHLTRVLHYKNYPQWMI